MEKLQHYFLKLLEQVPLDFHRFLRDKIDWSHRMIAISGARGTGKTTFLLQTIKERFSITSPLQVLYASLDNLWFGSHTLVELAEEFCKYGGKFLFLDEVHKYPGWSRELKNIYDTYSQLKIVFAGSSLLDISRSEADLSRRVTLYAMAGMSFREYLNMTGHALKPISLGNILERHLEISTDLNKQIEFPLLHFKDYLHKGYYPFFKEAGEYYPIQLAQIINVVLENDIPAVHPIEYPTILKIKKLLNLLAVSAPIKPNITKLSRLVGVSRNYLVEFIHLLGQANLLHNVTAQGQTFSILAKPEKIYFHNPNLYFALGENPTIGSLRETFFLNQLSVTHQVNYPGKGDFLVNEKYIFEVGGKKKDFRKIKDFDHSYIAADGIEYGIGNKIPLWLFGFLY
ncbi:MAG: ATP-binding protein [Bacteroidetes bacterium]|nr:ATP-binding protein [Bacteroidota bacterium]